jgi:ribose transport system permease protein
MLGLLTVLGLFIGLVAWEGQLETFLTLGNLQVLLHKSSIVGVVALGMLLVIISGGIDLSVGYVVALVTVVTMQVYRALELQTGNSGLVSLGAVAAGLTTGALCGLANGLAITRLRVAPFVATLGMMSIARGLAVWLAERRVIPFRGERPGWVKVMELANAENTLFDPGVWSLLLLAVVIALVLHRTVFGRHCYAVGSSEPTARLCGVSIGRTKLGIYCLAGLLTGWGGILTFAHSSSGDPHVGGELALDVIAAVVIGGASLSGGQGSVSGTLLGVLILGVLENGVSFFNVPLEAKYILIGLIVILNTALSNWQRRRRGG